MRFEVNCAKSHHHVISDGLYIVCTSVKWSLCQLVPCQYSINTECDFLCALIFCIFSFDTRRVRNTLSSICCVRDITWLSSHFHFLNQLLDFQTFIKRSTCTQKSCQLQSIFTHVASIYANLLEKKKAFSREKSSTPRGFSGYTNMASLSLFWNTNMAAMMSCENALFPKGDTKYMFGYICIFRKYRYMYMLYQRECVTNKQHIPMLLY